jgi:hypothetical protein
MCVTLAIAQDNVWTNYYNTYINNEPHEINAVLSRFAEYTFRVDNVLSGDVSDAGLDSLMEIFSPDFTTWNADLQPGVNNPVPQPPVLLSGGVYYDQLREKYYNISTQQYAGYSSHFLIGPSVNHTRDLAFGRPVYNVRAHLLEKCAMTVFGNPEGDGAQIDGWYDCDWVKDTDGVFRMLRFYSNNRKIYPDPNIPTGSKLTPWG